MHVRRMREDRPREQLSIRRKLERTLAVVGILAITGILTAASVSENWSFGGDVTIGGDAVVMTDLDARQDFDCDHDAILGTNSDDNLTVNAKQANAAQVTMSDTVHFGANATMDTTGRFRATLIADFFVLNYWTGAFPGTADMRPGWTAIRQTAGAGTLYTLNANKSSWLEIPFQ